MPLSRSIPHLPKFVTVFRLRNGFWNALLGSILVSLSNAVSFWLLSLLGLDGA